jgi:hypothetical protein
VLPHSAASLLLPPPYSNDASLFTQVRPKQLTPQKKALIFIAYHPLLVSCRIFHFCLSSEFADCYSSSRLWLDLVQCCCCTCVSLISQPGQKKSGIIPIEGCLVAGVYGAEFIHIPVSFFRRSTNTILRLVIIFCIQTRPENR